MSVQFELALSTSISLYLLLMKTEYKSSKAWYNQGGPTLHVIFVGAVKTLFHHACLHHDHSDICKKIKTEKAKLLGGIVERNAELDKNL